MTKFPKLKSAGVSGAVLLGKEQLTKVTKKGMSLEDRMVSETKTAPSKDLLNQITEKATEGRAKQDEIATVEEHLSGLKAELHGIVTVEIPKLMASAQMESFKLEDGTTVSLKEILTGSIPKDPERKQKALDWIEDEGAGEIIKTMVDMSFGRGSRKIVTAVEKALRKLKVDFNSEENVHPQTLQAFARERMKNGENVPLETLGLFSLNAAIIKPPKEKK